MATRTVILHNLKEAKAEVREDKRKKAYDGFKEEKSAYQVAKELKINKKTVYTWFERFRTEGESGVIENRRGPQKFTNASLKPNQVKKLENDIRDKTPDQMKFKFALWSSKAIQEYVKRTMGIEISRRTARRYMNKLGFTYKVPERRAREQNSEAVNKWLNDTYPKIKQKAKQHGAIIMWADETANMAGGERRAGYSPKGKPAILKAPDKRKIRCNSISAVSNRGDLDFMFFKGSMNEDIFKEFCEKLIASKKKPLYLIVDNLNVHHAKKLKTWAEAQKEINGFHIFYLPSYSPELNPDEYLNRDVKAHLAEQSIPQSSEELEMRISLHLTTRQKDRQSVIKFFHKKEVLYAS